MDDIALVISGKHFDESLKTYKTGLIMIRSWIAGIDFKVPVTTYQQEEENLLSLR